jgi:RecQ-mediated genome instability protein 1
MAAELATRHGVFVRPGWGGGAAATAAQLLEQLLAADLAGPGLLSRGALPPQVAAMHKRVLPGPYLLQVNEMLDVARSALAQLDALDGLAPTTTESALDEIFGPTPAANTQATSTARKGAAAAGGGAAPLAQRLLRLTLTDGVQTVTAMEYARIPALGGAVGVGGKVVVTNVEVRRGVLVLVPATVRPLGGQIPGWSDRADVRAQLRALLK